jgi:hypothetical protein
MTYVEIYPLKTRYLSIKNTVSHPLKTRYRSVAKPAFPQLHRCADGAVVDQRGRKVYGCYCFLPTVGVKTLKMTLRLCPYLLPSRGRGRQPATPFAPVGVKEARQAALCHPTPPRKHGKRTGKKSPFCSSSRTILPRNSVVTREHNGYS